MGIGKSNYRKMLEAVRETLKRRSRFSEKKLTNCKPNTELANEGRKPIRVSGKWRAVQFVARSNVKKRLSAKRRTVQLLRFSIIRFVVSARRRATQNRIEKVKCCGSQQIVV